MLIGILMLLGAYLLIYLEFFLPGGVLGLAGGLVYLLALATFAADAPSATVALIFIIGSLIGLAALVKIAINRIEHAPSGLSVYNAESMEDFKSSDFDEALVGQEGEADTDLRPAGYIRVDGRRMQAVSRMGYIAKGTEIEVIGGDGAHLIVKKATTQG